MGRGVRLLLVDSDSDRRSQTQTTLDETDLSPTVTAAPTSDRAMAQLRSGSFDCIVAALDVGTEDVVSFLSRVREYDDSVPFILFAADASTEIVRDLYELSRTDYVMAVPGAERTLLDRIVDLLDGSPMNEGPTQSQELPASVSGFGPVLELPGADSRLRYRRRRDRVQSRQRCVRNSVRLR
ncbi:response regulator [Halovenus salina]|uniref:Response regulator n=1 Tax=Halovenus salina TaxID=1510225 RepID=A0ABD5W350_9EURY